MKLENISHICVIVMVITQMIGLIVQILTLINTSKLLSIIG